jgi:hypothetical protein
MNLLYHESRDRSVSVICNTKLKKSGNNVGELWKHLKDINSVSKCHIKCINIDGKKCDNIEDVCNNFNRYLNRIM